jgi:ABC-type branched-subunit amino acid transport system substrate-binding protein
MMLKVRSSLRERFAPGLIVTFAALLIAAFTAPVPSSAAGMTEAQARGKRIYTEGKGSGRIEAFLEGPGLTALGSGFPCVKCHMENGEGTMEGGVLSADITYYNLTKPYPGVRSSGRAHLPYDDRGLEAAIRDGVDPGGNRLHEAHPRYSISDKDMRDLIAYLKVLGREPAPGVYDNEVRVGMLLPGSGSLAEAGAEVRAVLAAYFSDLNARGGIFRRSVALVPLAYDPARQGGVLDAVRGPLEKEEIFCLLGNLGVPQADEAAKFMSGGKVPVMVPLQFAPESGYGTDRYTFHLFASIRDQARVMVDFLADGRKPPARRIALVHATDAAGEAGAAGAREQAEKHKIAIVSETPFAEGALSPADAVVRAKASAPDAVLFFGPGRDAQAFISEAGRRSWKPPFLIPAPMAGNHLYSLPPELAGPVLLTVPIPSPDPSALDLGEFHRLRRKHNVGEKHMSLQLMAFAGAMLLEEGLKRSGRDVTREKFVDAVGSLYEFRTGVTPPVTFNENRRAGVRGAAIYRIDIDAKRLVPEAPWREPR